MNPPQQFIVAPEHVGQRIDVLLTQFLQQQIDSDGVLLGVELVPTRAKVGRWIEEGCLQLNGKELKKASHKARLGEEFVLHIPQPEKLELEPDPNVQFEVVYEDQDMIVLDKPPGLVVHPAAGHTEGTLVHGLLHHLGESIRSVGSAQRPGIVHRLDRDTSGLMLVAKNDFSHQALLQQFLPPRSVSRGYLALCQAVPYSGKGEEGGTIDAPIGRHSRDRKKMAVVENGKEAVTHWRLREAFLHAALLELRLETGRTHQIRVHLQSQRAAILGDPVYGPGEKTIPAKLRGALKRLGRQALHAYYLSFLSPRTGEKMEFQSELPEDIAEVLRIFRDSSN